MVANDESTSRIDIQNPQVFLINFCYGDKEIVFFFFVQGRRQKMKRDRGMAFERDGKGFMLRAAGNDFFAELLSPLFYTVFCPLFFLLVWLGSGVYASS